MARKRPNIILIDTDQQRADTIRYGGSDWMITPHLDELAKDGVLFSNAFCAGATCMSSRASFYTGLYPHTTGIVRFQRYTGAQNWTHRLREAGYRTVSIGKTHIAGGRHGYDERIAEQGNKYSPDYKDGDGTVKRRARWVDDLAKAGFEPPLKIHESWPGDFWENLAAIEWPLPEELHPDRWMGDQAVEWIGDYEPGDEPLFLHIGLLGPHDLYDPPKRYIDLYDDADIPMPEVTEAELAGMPDELHETARRGAEITNITGIRKDRATPERIRRMRKHYFANVTLIDETVGRIVQALKDKGLYDDAVIVFTSDHGDHLFDHDLYYKGELYDTIVNIPLIVRAPGVSEPGRRVNDLTCHLDVAQTILACAGVDATDLEGMSLQPVLAEGAPHARRYVYAEEGASALRRAPDMLAMIRSDTHKLVYFSGGRTGQLFDLASDPGETINLWDRPEYAEVRHELTARLLDWLYRSLSRHADCYASAR